MPITEALKKLIKTITGKNAVGETIEELVTNLNDNYPEGGSGGGDTYETVAEIAVGTMEYSEEIDAYVADGLTPSQTLPRSSNDLYFNNAAYPLTYYADEPAYVHNFNMATGTATGTPSYAVLFDGSTVNLVSDTDAIKNTTVRILKKVSGGGGSVTVDSELDADSENPVQNKVITAALGNAGIDYKVSVTVTIDEQTQQPTIAVDKSVKEICEAAVLDKHCWASIIINGVITAYQRMELTEAAAAAGTYSVTFGGVQNDDGAAKPVVLRGENTNLGEKESDEWTPN